MRFIFGKNQILIKIVTKRNQQGCPLFDAYIYIYMFIEVSADGFYVIRDFSGFSAWV